MYTTLCKKIQVKHVNGSNAIVSTSQTVWMLIVDVSMLFSSLSFLMIGLGIMIELPLSELQYAVLKTTMWHLIIVGLCLDEGRSVASKMLGMRVFGFLGKKLFSFISHTISHNCRYKISVFYLSHPNYLLHIKTCCSCSCAHISCSDCKANV